MGKVEERRKKLRETLVDIAEARITCDGIDAVKARDLAKEAGCAVGAIYNVFDDINELVMAVNGRTFRNLGAAVSQSAQGMENADPTDVLITMSYAYVDFATEHPRRWRTLFDLRMAADEVVPIWYLSELARVFGLIAAPLRKIYPDESDERIELMTRALFSSVHGITLLGLENRISGVPRENIREMIAFLLGNATSHAK